MLIKSLELKNFKKEVAISYQTTVKI